MNTVVSIPLNQLLPSPRNVRKTKTQNDASLIASIEAHGLLQNLTVVETGKASTYYVIAGGRRLDALKALAKAGKLEATTAIPCQVIEETQSSEVSLAENVIREAMHPADQFDAFRGMVEDGLPIPDVAANFGVSETVVKQRLKLANVSPKLLAEYRAGNATLEQMQALAISDSHKAQEKAWNVDSKFERAPRELIKKLTEKEIPSDDPRVKFVGLESYEAAGGAVKRDLFSSNAYIADSKLLDKLVGKNLESLCAEVQAEGWAWVELREKISQSERWEYKQAGKPSIRKPTDEEQAEMTRLSKRYDELEELIYGEDAPDDTTDLETEHEDIGRRLEKLDEATFEYPAKLKSKSGVLIYIDNDGINIDRGLLKPGEKAGNEKGSTNTGSSNESGQQQEKKDPTELSRAQIDRLYGERTAILRSKIASHAALAAMACSLVDNLLSLNGVGTPVCIRRIRNYESPDFKAGVDDHRESRIFDLDQQTWVKTLEKAKGDVYGWLLKQPEQTTIDLLAFLAASAITAQDDGKEFAQASGIDIAEHWAVTESWLSKQSTAYIVAAVTESAGKAEAAKLSKCKGKSAIAAMAADLMNAPNSKPWLPAPLRAIPPPKASKKK